jgi:acetyl-CoA acetyltransferase
MSILIQIGKFRRCTQAVSEGRFAEEIIPIELRGVVVSKDDTIRSGVTLAGLAGLKPAFPDWGGSTTTAGNASGVGDGAALCILTTRSEANRRGLEIIGKYVTSAVVGQLVTPASLVFFYSRAYKESSLGIWASHQYMPYPRL